MPLVTELVEGYRRFRSGTYSKQAALYEALGHGQSPKVMLIGCADSRADPSDIFDAAPGELFVLRNVANLVPPYQPGDDVHGVSAAVEYAVTALKVQHIVIMGHASCGGVGASLASADGPLDGEFIGPWVRLLDEARDAVKASGSDTPQHSLELAGIAASIANLMTFPFVAAAVEAGTLELHGAWFSISNGELHWRDPETETFSLVD